MDRPVEPLSAALALLEHRWGTAVVRLGDGRRGPARPGYPAGAVLPVPDAGALAPVLVPEEMPAPAGTIEPTGDPATRAALLPASRTAPAPDAGPDLYAAPDPRVISTGFPALDAILGPGGLVRDAGVTLRGGESSGKTTLALRCIAEAQRRGAIAAWLDLGRSFDPLEAVARGVDLAWLLVLRPADTVEGLRIAGALLGGRTVELLVVDLPPRLPAAREGLLRRLAGRARLAGARLVVLEPLGLAGPLRGALAETASVGLELQRHGWIRSGRDVVGQRTLVTVARNRFGPPGRRVELEIRYVDEGDRARGVERFLDAGPPDRLTVLPQVRDELPPRPLPRDPGSTFDAPSPPRLAPSASPPRTRRPAQHPGARGDRRQAVGRGNGARLQPRRASPGNPAGHAAGKGTPARS